MTPHTPHSVQNLPIYTFISFHLSYANTLPYADDLPYTTDLPYAALNGWPTLHCPRWWPTLHWPMLDLPYTSNLPYTDNLPNSKDLLNSEFLVCPQIISGCDPLHTFAELSGAWEVPS